MGRLNRADKLYDRLLYIYPSAYRRRFSQEMRQNFRDLYRANNEKGRPGWIFWSSALGDLAAGAIDQYGDLIRCEVAMKMYPENAADQKTFLWGMLLMVPAGLFFLTAIIASVLNLQLMNNINYSGAVLYLFLICLIALPALATLINLVPLTRQVIKKHERILARSFVKRYFWSLAMIAISLGWIAFLFGHDTVGCATHYLPHLNWQAFQLCAAAS